MFLSFSFWDIIQVPFGYALEWLYRFFNNYGIALIVFTLLVKLILLPAGIKSKKSMMKVSRMSPQLKMLERKYGDDKEAYQKAMLALYKEEGVSMYSGCLWSFLPLLILIPLYAVIRQPLQYLIHMTPEQAASALEIMGKSLDLGRQGYQQLVAASHVTEFADALLAAMPELANKTLESINFTFLGVDLSAIPNWRIWTYPQFNWATIGLCLIPFAAGASQLVSALISQKLNASVATNEKGEVDAAAADKANEMSKSMLYSMPIVSLIFCYMMPAALGVYWIAQALMALLQEVLLTSVLRKGYDEEDAAKQEAALQKAIAEAEKERQRAQRRAENPDGITENTSKKKLQQKQKEEADAAAREYAARKRAELGLSPEEGEEKPLSGIPDRPFCRGRAYKPERYGRNTLESDET